MKYLLLSFLIPPPQYACIILSGSNFEGMEDPKKGKRASTVVHFFDCLHVDGYWPFTHTQRCNMGFDLCALESGEEN